MSPISIERSGCQKICTHITEQTSRLRPSCPIAGYQTAYSQLAFAGKKVHDPVGETVDPKLLLAKNLEKFSATCPGKVRQMPALKTTQC